MKSIFAFLLCLGCFTGFAQTDDTLQYTSDYRTYGMRPQRLWPSKILSFPYDTLSSAKDGSVAFKNGIPYIKILHWVAFNTGSVSSDDAILNQFVSKQNARAWFKNIKIDSISTAKFNVNPTGIYMDVDSVETPELVYVKATSNQVKYSSIQTLEDALYELRCPIEFGDINGNLADNFPIDSALATKQDLIPDFDLAVRNSMNTTFNGEISYIEYTHDNNLVTVSGDLDDFDAVGIRGGYYRYRSTTAGADRPSPSGGGIVYIHAFNDSNVVNGIDKAVMIGYDVSINKYFGRYFNETIWEPTSISLTKDANEYVELESQVANPARSVDANKIYSDGSNNLRFQGPVYDVIWDQETMVDNVRFDVEKIMQTSDNLANLANTTTSRNNLGLGDMSTQSSNAVSITSGSIQASELKLPTVTTLTVNGSVGLNSSTHNFTFKLSSGQYTTLTDANNLSELTNTSNALNNLGGSTIGKSVFSSTNPSAVTFLRGNADNTVSWRGANQLLGDLGGTTVGINLVTAVNPSAITFLRVNANNSIDLLDAASFRTAIGAGTGGGSGDALVANPLSQFAATTSAQLRGVLSDELGTGEALFDGATPTALVLTNATGTASGLTAGNVTTNANLTGVVTSTGNATAIANGAITNAMLANGAVANLSGTNTGDQTSVTGNAGTATTLQTSRNINGTAFNGSADITITAAAGTLTGATLNASVLASSLTSHGTITSGGLGTGAVIAGVTMTLGSDGSNDTYYRNASGVLTRLANGATGQIYISTTGSAPSWGTSIGVANANFRTTNGGANIAAQFLINVDGSAATAGAQAFAFETANGFVFTHGNGTRSKAGASIKLTNLTNTAGSESSDLSFSTGLAGAAPAERFRITAAGGLVINTTVTAGGTTGAQTINKPSGSVNFAAAATTLVVTNSLVTTSSQVVVTVYGTDVTATSARVTLAAGSFTITLNAAATAETKVGFVVLN